MTVCNYCPETIAEKDVAYIREVYRKSPTVETIKKLAEQYGVSFGTIQRYLGKLADEKRLRDKRLMAEANEREKQKARDRVLRKKGDRDGAWVIPSSLSKSVLLRVTPEQEAKLVEIAREMRAFIAYALEAYARRFTPDYEVVKKFRLKNDAVGAKSLDVLQRTKVLGMVRASVRNARLAADCIPFQGSHGNTAGDARVVVCDGKYFLRYAQMDFELMLGEDDDYYCYHVEKPLLDCLREEDLPSGEIFKAKNGFWYCRFSLKRAPPKILFDDDSPRVFKVIQPMFTQVGCKWLEFDYDEGNRLIHKVTLLRDTAWLRLVRTERDYITYYVRRAVNISMERTWHRLHQTLRPVVILLDAVGDPPSREVANLNPTYRFRLYASDKLAEYDGLGFTVRECPNDIEVIRRRLSL